MRTLATLALSFAATVFVSVLLPWDGWQFWTALVLVVLAVAALLLRKKLPYGKRVLLILCAAAAGLLYFRVYDTLVCRPFVNRCGEEAQAFSGVVADDPIATDYGGKVTVWLRTGVKAVYYGEEEVMDLRPGQRISGTARWQDAARIRETSITTFTARGVFVLLYGRGELTAESALENSVWFLPQRAARAVKERISQIWDDPVTAAFVLAELTGDRSHIAEEDSAAMSEAGLAHLFAVSGLHCAFLVTLLGLLIPPHRRRTYCIVTSLVLLFYMVMVGLSPSVVRACIMQIFLLAAPLLRRESDPLTALSAALLILLLANPYAAGGISLQLSFAATLGLILLARRLYQFFTGFYRGKRRKLRYAVALVSANVSASLAALVFTVPLTAFYFNIFTLISPVSNLLAVPVAGWNFMAGLLTVLLGFVWLPAAQFVGWLSWLMVHYVLLIARWLMRLPYHALYFSNRYLAWWLLYAYVLLGFCWLTKGRRRRYVLAGLLVAAMLLVCIGVNRREFRYGTMDAVAVDVGQGECVLLYSGSEAVMVDCGSSNSYIQAGGRAADLLGSIGYHRLKAVVLTHYHADHTNGMYELLARVPVEQLWLPDIEDEFGVRDRLVGLAERYGIELVYICDPSAMAVGEAELTVYPPIGEGDMNEQGLTILCSAGDFDLLITGDMAGSTEKRLIDAYELPDVEVLVVSHHGSKYSSAREFLEEVRPETAIISVGDNSYGHPAEETIRRLWAAGAEVCRTDEQGDILVTVYGGKK
ncbi:MAG: DNA internalization-related competence protein ComEC/Rec2 [Ruminococcaceae bacterium]|nr:DNA internalization-related competence protein ComEC/Rec2 [Oscillospiraceae bacterium]